MKVLVAGGTGLIGSFLLKALDADSRVESVIAITRRPQQNFGKIEWREIDLGNVDQINNIAAGCQAAISCLGTTMKTAGSKSAFELVDFQFVVNLAEAAKKSGIEIFRVVSALGADSNSGVYYNRIKGKMEASVEALGFASLTFFRPSLLLGPRSEFRLGEKIGMMIMPLFSPLMLGGLRKYRPIQSEVVAKAMANSLFTEVPEKAVLFDEIQKLAIG